MSANPQPKTDVLHYAEYRWGEIITGTKSDLQAIGLGQGCAFPGEVGGPKRQFSTIDSRNFAVQVQRDRFEQHADVFAASVRFPGREMVWETPSLYAPGVTKSEACRGDVYVGTAPALLVAGLVLPHQLPGHPGCARKVTALVFPDGSMPDGPRTVRHSQGDGPGAKHITRQGVAKFEVCIRVDKAVEAARRQAMDAQERVHWAAMAAQPRPPRLRVPPGMRVKFTRDLVGVADEGDPCEQARAALAKLPKSKAAFLRECARDFRQMAAIFVALSLRRASEGCYAIDEDSLGDIVVSFDSVTDAIMQAGVSFDQARHRAIVEGLQTTLARHDVGFQATLSGLFAPAPALLLQDDVRGVAP